ncbi:Powdery mildew resistance protein, RPW8 domain [Dillenia turbinata]|uniref:Powdery mildew resistance protein, RPW8 domain n=1 Tax=Dillenia turbinata TaxID=194707 RepID=A0AAN8V171_9MAGN
MALALFEGGLVGTACSELWRVVSEEIKKTIYFKRILKKIESTLFAINPLIQNFQFLSMKLDKSKEETKFLIQQMREGKTLVEKCSKIRWWKRSRYYEKLQDLDQNLLRFFQIDLQLINVRNGLETLVEVKDFRDDFFMKFEKMSLGSKRLSSFSVPLPPKFTVGFDKPLRELKQRLLKGSEFVIVVSGAAGFGKTTLVKMLCNDNEVKRKFRKSYFVRVSKMRNFKDIVQQLFQGADYAVPELQDDEEALNRLQCLLNELPKPALVVFDDVWSATLMQKINFHVPECNILVTSRCSYAGFASFRLNALDDDDASALLCHSAFQGDGSFSMPDGHIVKKIVKGCGRSPLALTVVGNSLYGRSAEAWHKRAMKWSEGQSIYDSDSAVLDCLQTSLEEDVLDENLKECFLDLGAFLEGQWIPVAAIIDVWVEMYGVDEDGICTMKDADKVDGYYNEHFVMQHDLLRELAIYRSNQELIEHRKRLIVEISGDKFPKWWSDQEQQCGSACLLSISTDGTFSSDWPRAELPEVEVVVLNFQSLKYILPQFLENMPKLKVLIVTYNGYGCAELAQFSVTGSLPNLKRIRFEQVTIPSFSETTMCFNNLQKMSFVMCEIGQAFRAITLKMSSLFPSLVDIDLDYCKDLVEFPQSLCDLVFLRKLCISNCPKFRALPAEIEKLKSLEVLRLHACVGLSKLPDSVCSLHKLYFIDICDCESMKTLPEKIGEFIGMEPVSGAFLGELAGELLGTLSDVKNKVTSFKSEFERLESTLELMIPKLNETKELNRELGCPGSGIEKLDESLKEGKELVKRCSEVYWWDMWSKFRCSKMILKLDESLSSFFHRDLLLENSIDNKKILVEMKRSFRRLDSSHSVLNCAVPEIPALVVGLDEPLVELKRKLLRENVSILVLSGPGGCGKTTLASKFCRDKQVKDKYGESIIFVTVSNNPNVKVIAQRVFEQMDKRVSEFQNDEDAINQLKFLLNQKDHKCRLLVLDDVWPGSEYLLNHLLSPVPRCQVLVTSRYKFPTFGSTYKWKFLNDQDAMKLFCHLAFPQDCSYPRPGEELLDKIVRRCKGLPLAIVVVANSLCRRPEVMWQHLEKKCSEGQSILEYGHEGYLLSCLASSIDFLDDVVKDCFLDLGSFPEDQKISASTLLDIWVELYGLDEDDVYVNLLELSARNLLNLIVNTRKDITEVDGCYNELFVMQHDLLRELAIHYSNQHNLKQRDRIFMNEKENYFAKRFAEQNLGPLKARLLSISTDDAFSSSWFNVLVPELQVLILNISATTYTLPKFMNETNNLKVLIIISYEFSHTEISNFAQICYLPSLKRIRLEKVFIPTFNNVDIPMRNLYKLSLVRCRVGQAFKNCTVQLFSIFPNLVEIELDYCYDLVELPAGLCGIISLQKLCITNCHRLSTLPREIGELENLVQLRLHACTKLVRLPNTIGHLSKLCFIDISDCSSMKKLPEQIGQLRSLTKLDMRRCSQMSDLPTTVENLVNLKEVICDEEIASVWEDFRDCLLKLIVRKPEEHINLNWL